MAVAVPTAVVMQVDMWLLVTVWMVEANAVLGVGARGRARVIYRHSSMVVSPDLDDFTIGLLGHP